MGILDQYIRAHQLNAVLPGRHFTGMEVTKHLETNLNLHFSDFGGHDPTGKMILKVCKDNEYIEIQMEGGYYLYWAGKETLYHTTPASLPKAYGLKLTVDDGSLLTIHIPGMGGALCLANQAEFDAGKMQQTQKPRHRLSALDDVRFTFEAFQAAALARKDSIVCSAFIALGDLGYLPDSLYVAKINPRTKVRNLSEADLRRLYEAVKQVNAEILALHGEVLEKDVYGCPGGYKRKMAGHLARKPCPACGEPVQKQTNITGEGFYYCPGCQPLQ